MKFCLFLGSDGSSRFYIYDSGNFCYVSQFYIIYNLAHVCVCSNLLWLCFNLSQINYDNMAAIVTGSVIDNYEEASYSCM